MWAISQAWPSGSRKLPSVAAVEGLRTGPGHDGASAASLLDDLVHSSGEPTWRSAIRQALAGVVDSHVARELLAAPQHQDDSVRLEEDRLFDLECRSLQVSPNRVEDLVWPAA